MSFAERYRRDYPASHPPPSIASSDGHSSGHSNDGHNGGHTAGYNAGRRGRYPAGNRNGGHPADRLDGGHLGDSHSAEFPADSRNGGYPAGRSGGYPTDNHDGGYPADARSGRYPADENSGGYPAAISGAGGFTFLRDPVPPAGADPRLWSCFLAVDTDRSGSISVHELQRALINGDSTPFDPETVKLLISLFDANQTGEIDFDEFTRLSRYIEDWRRMFQHFDQDYSGTIDGTELQSALNQFGMKLPPHLVSLLVAKFASSPIGSQVDDQTITFDRFIRACVFMKKFKKSFGNLDRDKDGWVQLSYEQCLKFYLMLP